MSESNELLSAGAQLIGMPLAGPESFSEQQLTYLKKSLDVDETVLWAGSATLSSPTISLSETLSNFSRVKIYWKTWNASFSSVISEFDVVSGNDFFTCIGGYWNGTNASTFIISLTPNGTQTALTLSAGKFIYLGTSGTPSNANYSTVYKVVGVGRISGGN